MTPDQQSQVTALRAKVSRMREGKQPDDIIRAGLIAEGWAAGAVIEAMGPDHAAMIEITTTQSSQPEYLDPFDTMTRPGNTLHDT